VLEPQSNALQNTPPIQSEDLTYGFIRRERLPTMGATTSSPDGQDIIGGTNAMSGTVPPADRQLTIRDLYRQTDETLDTQGPALREKSLKGIQNAQFRYFDGTAWSSQWDSRKQMGYPVAVAVQFDFPSRSKARRDRVQSKIETNSSIEAEVSSEQSFGSIDTLLSQQSTTQTEATDSQDYLITTANTEVTIVVATHFRPANWKREEAESAIRDDARSNRKNSSRSSP
jgi:hypothetical protein